MILRLALRSLSTRPLRTAVLAIGFGLGIGVMVELLGVGEVILEQAHAPVLQGGGDLVATGFDAWGISNGTVAASIIADLATGRDNRWLEMFDARRVKPIAGGAQFAKANVEVAAELVGGWLSRKPKSYDEIAPGEAAILSIDGEKVAAFRDEAGSVHAVPGA